MRFTTSVSHAAILVMLTASCGDPAEDGTGTGPGAGGAAGATSTSTADASSATTTSGGPGGGSGTGGGEGGSGGGGGSGNVLRSIAYHQLTRDAATLPTGRPVLSRDGSRLAFPVAPGTGTAETPNRIYVVDADGTGMSEVDSYTSLCGCGAKLAISDDGGTVVSTDSVQIRVVDAGGGLRSSLVLTSNEIWAVAISGDGGRVFFEMGRDAANFDTGVPIQRGVYEMDADTGEIVQIISPQQVASTFGEPNPDNVFTFAGCGNSLDVSSDGEIVVAATNVIGQGQAVVGRGGSAVMPPNSQGFGNVQSIAISGDGSTVGVWRDGDNGATEVGVVSPDGSGHRILEPQGGGPGCFAPISLTDDGSQLLLGYGATFYATDGSGSPWSALLQSGATGGTQFALGEPDGGNSRDAVVSGDGRRIAYLSNDGVLGRQVAIAEIDAIDLGPVPGIEEPMLDPTTIPNDLTVGSTVTVRVIAAADELRVGTSAMLEEVNDPNLGFGALHLNDGGVSGDATAGDGIWSANGIFASTTAEPGPRWVRVKAEAVDGNGWRSALALDFGPLVVE